jgi:hypothetical protein
MKSSPARATLSVVPSEDGKAWQAQFAWDDGRIDRFFRFERNEEAEAWIDLARSQRPTWTHANLAATSERLLTNPAAEG